MSWKSFACLAVAAALSAPALAQPSFSVDGSTLQVVVDAMGSVAVEVAITGSDIAPASGDPADALFDTPNPGANPFTGGTTTGAFVDGGNIFISYGSDVLSPGTYDLWEFTGSGTADVTGLIAQLGVVNDGLTATIDLGGGFNRSDFNMDGTVDIVDFGTFSASFSSGDADLTGDLNDDSTVDIVDFGLFSADFQSFQGGAVAVPEPAAALIALIGFACVGARRS